MLKHRYYRKENQKAIIDMNDFLMTYGETILGVGTPNLAERISQAGQNDLTGLDRLFHDNGFGRQHKYIDICQGFVSDLYSLDGEAAHQKAIQLAHRAIRELGSHAKQYDHWKQA